MGNARKSHRRDFLRGRSAVDALADAAGRALGNVEPSPAGALSLGPDASQDGYLLRMSRRAMACDFEIIQSAGQYPQGSVAVLAAFDLVERLEDQLSVYREQSEVSRLNRAAFDQSTPVEARLFELFRVARRLHAETAGAIDITAGPLSRVWGFMRRQGAMPDAGALAGALALVGTDLLELDEAAQTARFRKPGMEINLGAIGKGYALDRAGELLAEQGMRDVLLQAGASSVLARGARRPGPDEAGWLVELRHPLRIDRSLAQVRLRDVALATSGSAVQYFMHEGRRMGHLIDPRSGWPAEGVLSATVVAPTAAEADALSTAFYVLGPAGAAAYCEARPKVAALLTTPHKSSQGLELHVFGLEKEAGGGENPIFAPLPDR